MKRQLSSNRAWRAWFVLSFLIGVCGKAFAAAPDSELRIETDFPGGSAKVIDLDQEGRRLSINPMPHPDRGWDCWWYFKLSGVKPGETITLDVGNAPWATPTRAAVSQDNRRWRQTAPGRREGKRIVYQHTANADTVWFAWGPPFVPEDAQRLVDEAATKPFATKFNLCDTRGGRPTPALRISQADSATQNPRYGIWIQARQHAWESGSSWVCRGLVEWLISDDPRAAALRHRADITVVPIMDIDNVAIGAGGKQQTPQDHNRDWTASPHWRSVAAAMRHISKANDTQAFDLFLDLHNPDAGTREPFFFVAPDSMLSPLGRANLERFLAANKEEMTGPLQFKGRKRESGPGYDRQWKAISKNWVSENCHPHVVAVTLETAWNTPHSTTDGYRTVGKQLGLATERYFRHSPRKTAAEAE